MAQTTVNLSNSVRVQYAEDYLKAAMYQRVYDNFATFRIFGMPMNQLEKSSSVQVDFISDMAPGVNAISEIADVIPQTRRDAKATISYTSRGELLQFSQALAIAAYTNYGKSCYDAVGKNMMESVELVAQTYALGGSLAQSPAARSSLDAGTTGHNASFSLFSNAATILQAIRCPAFVTPTGNVWFAAMRPEAYYDLRTSTPVLQIAQYQDKEILLSGEVGRLESFKIVVSAFAKVFGAAGAANGTAVSTSVNAQAKALDKTIVTLADVSASIAKGRYWMIGPAVETGSTIQPLNEVVMRDSSTTSGTTVGVIGEGADGGLRFDHGIGDLVKNADPVYPILFGSDQSLAKLYAEETGEFGQTVGPNIIGGLEQFTQLGWKWFGGYGRLSESWMLRTEVSCSLDNV